MKKTCSRIISLILSLTVLCSMLIGFGAIEGVAAEEVQLVKRDVHLDIDNINYITTASTDWYYTGSGYTPREGTTINTSMFFRTIPEVTTVDEKKVLKICTQNGGYFDIYADANNTSFNSTYSNGIFEVTGTIMADHDTKSGDNWNTYYTGGSYTSMFRTQYDSIEANTWYNFVMKIDLEKDYGYVEFVDINNEKPVLRKVSPDYVKDFKAIRLRTSIPADSYLYLGDLKISYYDVAPGKKAVINSVDTTPGKNLSFTLSKALTGLTKDHVYITGSENQKNLATALVDNGNGSYTVTLENELAATTDYTLNIDGDYYGDVLEMEKVEAETGKYIYNAVAVKDTIQAFTTTEAVFTEESTIDEITEAMTWEALMPDVDSAALTFETKLPTSYRGASFTWESVPAGYVTADGQIKASKEVNVDVTLNANVSVKSVEKGTVSYDAKILKEDLVTESVAATQLVQVAATSPDEVIPGYNTTIGRYHVYYMTSRGINSDGGSRGDELAFMQWDLKRLADYMQKIDIAKSIKIKIFNQTDKADNKPVGSDGIITILNDSSDDWTAAALTYNDAVKKGMYTDPGLARVTNVDYTLDAIEGNDPSETMKGIDTIAGSDDLTKGIKDALAQNPDQGLVSARFTNTSSNTTRMRPWTEAGGTMEISYYKSDLMTASDFAKSKAGKMTWGAISTQDINNVVADLTLPTTWYGEDVVWSSENTAIAITDNTAVVTTGTKTTGNLIATVGGVKNEFEVTVSDKDIALGSDRTYTEDEITNFNYSTGYIYANEAVEDEYTAIIATYNADGELVGLTVKNREAFPIAKGRNILPSGLHYAFADATTKVILVNNMTDLTPLAVAK